MCIRDSLPAAVGTLVQDPLEAVRPERLCDGNMILLLLPEIVEGKDLIQRRIQFRHAFFLNLRRGKQAGDLRPNLDLPLLEHIVQGLSLIHI